MDKKNLENILGVLNHYDNEYSLCNNRKEKERIKERVFNYSKNLPDEVYLELNDGAASGLFRCGHFEADMSSSINKLKEMIKES